jgi:hypothetical protein
MRVPVSALGVANVAAIPEAYTILPSEYKQSVLMHQSATLGITKIYLMDIVCMNYMKLDFNTRPLARMAPHERLNGYWSGMEWIDLAQDRNQ